VTGTTNRSTSGRPRGDFYALSASDRKRTGIVRRRRRLFVAGPLQVIE